MIILFCRAERSTRELLNVGSHYTSNYFNYFRLCIKQFPLRQMLDKDIQGNPNCSSLRTYGKLCSWGGGSCMLGDIVWIWFSCGNTYITKAWVTKSIPTLNIWLQTSYLINSSALFQTQFQKTNTEIKIIKLCRVGFLLGFVIKVRAQRNKSLFV